MSSLVLLALVASAAPASALADHEVAGRVFALPWFASYPGGAFGEAVDLGWRVRPWLVAGASDELAGASNSDGCWYEKKCLFGWRTIAPFLRAEANADGVVVPYARLMAGLAWLTAGRDPAPDQPIALFAAPEVGLDLHVWRLRLGAFVGMRIVAQNAALGGFGARLSYEW